MNLIALRNFQDAHNPAKHYVAGEVIKNVSNERAEELLAAKDRNGKPFVEAVKAEKKASKKAKVVEELPEIIIGEKTPEENHDPKGDIEEVIEEAE